MVEKEETTEETKEVVNVIDEEVSKPTAWLRAVYQEKNVSESYIWHVNKERTFDFYGHRYNIYYEDGEQKTHKYDEENELPKNGYLFQQLILPNGKIIIPIRQFCETKILAQGEIEAIFFNFTSVYKPEPEYDNKFGELPKAKPQPIITSQKIQTKPRGTMLTIDYSQQTEGAVNIIASTNRAFSLESINDEATQVLRAGDESNVLDGHWLDGNGKAITNDLKKKKPLTLKGLIHASQAIAEGGLDPSRLILYARGKAIIDLFKDPDAKRLKIKNINDIKNVLGITVVRSASVPKTEEYMPEGLWTKIKRVLRRHPRNIRRGGGYRATLFIPNVTFGLVSGQQLTMESERRVELQAVYITGTQKIAGVLKEPSGYVKISHS